jgi:hypothetical protein
MLAARPSIVPRAKERRRHQRVDVHLLGRFMLTDRKEYPCQIVNVSPGGAMVVAPVVGMPGERVVAYVDHLGRLEGTIVRQVPNGFAMTISATLRKRDKLAAQLTWLANRHRLGLGEDRRHERIVPRNPLSKLTLASGTVIPCRVLDISLSGAAVETEVKPPLGAPVTIGKTLGRVVRHFHGGFAVEFSRLLAPEVLEENVTGF